MNKNTILTAVATGILALSMGSNAVAADVAGTTKAAVQSTERSTKNNIVLEAGSDPSTLKLHFDGARRVAFYDAATLQITKEDGTTWKYRPNLSQTVNGKKKYLVPGFRIVGKDTVALSVSQYDASSPVMLDGAGPNS